MNQNSVVQCYKSLNEWCVLIRFDSHARNRFQHWNLLFVCLFSFFFFLNSGTLNHCVEPGDAKQDLYL